jgi:hypothetical protein
VAGRRLTFSKTSTDGSGKCDIELTGDGKSRVEGVLFWIERGEKPRLDIAEGLNRGYDEVTVDVVTAGGIEIGLTYVAGKKATDAARTPYHWYKALVIAGAIEHELPVADGLSRRAVHLRSGVRGARRARGRVGWRSPVGDRKSAATLVTYPAGLASRGVVCSRHYSESSESGQ